MPRAVPLRQDIPADALRRRAKQETDGRASRRMLAMAAVLDGASREEAARLAGMDRQSLRIGSIGSTKQASRACTIDRIPGGRRA